MTNGGVDRPTFRARGLPIDAFTAASFDGPPLRVPCVRFMDANSLNPFTRYPLQNDQPEQPGRVRFIDVMDEDQPTRISVESRRRGSNMSNEEPVLPEYNPYPERERRPDIRRMTLSPSSASRYQFGDPRAQEQPFRAVDGRLSAARANAFRQSIPKSGAQEVGLPIGKALRWLHEALVDVEKFFRKFQDDYNKEVKLIDKYAGAEILQHLWIRKVTGKGAPQDGSQDTKSGEMWEEKFAEKRRSLREALDAALSASLSLGDQETPKATTLESRKRLLEKVATADHHIMDLLDLVMKESEHCKGLPGELKMLKELVDPKKENKSLYDGVDTEEPGGNQDGGGGGYDGQPAWDENQ